MTEPAVAGPRRRLPALLHGVPPRWALFGTSVLTLLAVSLWLRATAPAAPRQPSPIPPPNSVAVLPFAPTGPDASQAYVGAGMADALIRALGEVPGLRVAGRSSSFTLGSRGADPRVVGRRLGVGAVVQGSFRRVGERLRVSARLVNVEEGFDLWSEIYEREDRDLFEIQDEILRSVVAALRVRGAIGRPPPRSERPTRNPAAYESYLLGREALDAPRSDVGAAVLRLEQAVALDSGFAAAQAALADGLVRVALVESLPPSDVLLRAQRTARLALALDSTLVRARTALGVVRLLHEWDWDGAEREFRSAIALNPNWPDTRLWYARLLTARGRSAEALAELDRARLLDPASPAIRLQLGWHHLYSREYAAAREALSRAAVLAPAAWEPIYLLGLAAAGLGDSSEALARLEKARMEAPNRLEPLAALGWLYAAMKREEDARRVLDQLRDLGAQRYVSPCHAGFIHAALGEPRLAMAWLARAEKARSTQLFSLRGDLRADPLRKDPRFTALLRRIGLE